MSLRKSFARGEHLIWLTGSALGVCLLMIGGLLAVILANGLGIFWPSRLERLTLRDGTLVAGEPMQRQAIPDPDRPGSPKKYRIQLKVGNRDLYGNYARFAEKALRVAILLASLENDDHIELRHWARGQAVAERWRADLHRLYAQVATEQAAPSPAERVVEVILRLNNPTAREIAQRIRGLDTSEVDKILATPLARGAVCQHEAGRARRFSVAGSEA
jgi:hypothetical protein